MHVKDYINKALYAFKHALELDLRSLALFRFCFGIMLLCDLIERSMNLESHYTDYGVFRREDMIHVEVDNNTIIIHSLSGRIEWQVILFILNGLICICFAIGYKTRLMAVLQWFFLSSIRKHSLYLDSGADTLSNVISFWLIFVPLDKVWSVDNIIKNWDSKDEIDEKKEKSYVAFGLCYAVLIFQIQLMYIVSTYHKKGKTWRELSSTFYALNLTLFQTSFARLLLKLDPKVLRFMTWGVLKWEFFGSFFYVSPILTQWCKIIGILGFISLHLGFCLSLKLGLFLWATTIPTLMFIPRMIWDGLFSYLKTDKRLNSKVHITTDSFFSKLLGLTLKYMLLLPYTTVDYIKGKDKIILLDEESNSEDCYIKLTLPNNKNLRNLEALIYIFQYLSPLTIVVGFILKTLPSLLKYYLTNLFCWLHQTSKYDSQNIKLSLDRSRLKRAYKSKTKNQKAKVRLVKNIIISFLFAIVFIWCFESTNTIRSVTPRIAHFIMDATKLRQKWGMFSPTVNKVSFYPVILGKLEDGNTTELFRSGAITLGTWDKHTEPINVDEKPVSIKGSYRWYKVFEAMDKNPSFAPLVGKFICRQYNRKNPNLRIKKLEITFIYEVAKEYEEKKFRSKTKYFDKDCF